MNYTKDKIIKEGAFQHACITYIRGDSRNFPWGFLTYGFVTVEARGIWGHAPPENFLGLLWSVSGASWSHYGLTTKAIATCSYLVLAFLEVVV